MDMNKDATLRRWLEQFTKATNEVVENIVLGWDEYDDLDDWEWDRWGQVTPLEDVPTTILDREFNDGFGGNNSPNLCGWSPNWVVFSDNYDGAEGLCWVPRAPIDHSPARPGGG